MREAQNLNFAESFSIMLEIFRKQQVHLLRTEKKVEKSGGEASIQRRGRGDNVDKAIVYQNELNKLKSIFEDVEPSKAKLVEGLLDDAALLKAENASLKRVIMETGMIKIHPEYPEMQKPTEAGKQYLKNVNSYAVVIKTLNSILGKDALEQDDEFDEFMKRRAEGG